MEEITFGEMLQLAATLLIALGAMAIAWQRFQGEASVFA